MDTIYTFAGFALYTYRAEDKSIIYLIELKDDTAATREGAKVGMTAGEIEALYGTGYTESGVIRSYPLGKDATLDFTMEDGKAALIEYVEITKETDGRVRLSLFVPEKRRRARMLGKTGGYGKQNGWRLSLSNDIIRLYRIRRKTP